MSKVNIKSENQSGGITAQNVNTARPGLEGQKGSKRKLSGKAWTIIVGIATLVGTIVAVLTYFGFNHK